MGYSIIRDDSKNGEIIKADVFKMDSIHILLVEETQLDKIEDIHQSTIHLTLEDWKRVSKMIEDLQNG